MQTVSDAVFAVAIIWAAGTVLASVLMSNWRPRADKENKIGADHADHI